ncbi:MAG: DUF2292 domain-containing protein [Candidatus Aenigmatarchaeota archaeon]
MALTTSIDPKRDGNVYETIKALIREKPYQTITIKIHDGKVVRIVREESIKVDSK